MDLNQILNHLNLGFSSSFVGALPLGMLNLTVLKMSLQGQQRQALAFSVGAVLVEFGQIFLSLLGMNVLLSIPYLREILTVVSIPILIILGIKNWKNHTNTEGGNLPIEGFKNGLILSAANVLVYPFWLLWGNIFVQNGWLMPQPLAFGVFSVGASIGTLGAFLVFILGGKLLWRYVTTLQNLMNRVIAAAFWGFAIYQTVGLVSLLNSVLRNA